MVSWSFDEVRLLDSDRGFRAHYVVGNVALCGVSGKFLSMRSVDTFLLCSTCHARRLDLRRIALAKSIVSVRASFPSYLDILKDKFWHLCGGRYYHDGGNLVEANAHLHFVWNGAALCNPDFTQQSHRMFPELPRCLNCLKYLGFVENVFPLKRRDFKRKFPVEWKEYLVSQRSLE